MSGGRKHYQRQLLEPLPQRQYSIVDWIEAACIILAVLAYVGGVVWLVTA